MLPKLQAGDLIYICSPAKAIENNNERTGYKICGYIHTNGVMNELGIKSLGKIEELNDIIKNNHIEDVIISIEQKERLRCIL